MGHKEKSWKTSDVHDPEYEALGKSYTGHRTDVLKKCSKLRVSNVES